MSLKYEPASEPLHISVTPRGAQVETIRETERRRAPIDWVLSADGPTPALDRAAREREGEEDASLQV